MERAKYLVILGALLFVLGGTGSAQSSAYISCTSDSSGKSCTYAPNPDCGGACNYNLSHAIMCIGGSLTGPQACAHSIYEVSGAPLPSTIDMCYKTTVGVAQIAVGQYYDVLNSLADTAQYFHLVQSNSYSSHEEWTEITTGTDSWCYKAPDIAGGHACPTSFAVTISDPTVVGIDVPMTLTGGGLVDTMNVSLIPHKPGTATLSATMNGMSDSLVVTVINSCAPAAEEPMIFVTM